MIEVIGLMLVVKPIIRKSYTRTLIHEILNPTEKITLQVDKKFILYKLNDLMKCKNSIMF